jgi:CheY-like chemotaxis protein
MAARVLVIHWNQAEAASRLEHLRGAGYDCDSVADYGKSYPAIRDHPPDAVVIDLTRRPSHGREVAIHLRRQKQTRGAALVLIEGDEEITAQMRTLLPDAVVTTWPRVRGALKRALENRPENPVVPGTFAGYSGTPLAKKLRIGDGALVALLHAPDGFQAKLEPLPDGVRFQKKADGAGVILAFFRTASDLQRRLPELAGQMRTGRTLWLIWPKKASGVPSDLTERNVREWAWPRASWITKSAR